MKYPIGIQSFESLINDGYIYVDKTALIYQLVHTGRYYFLSRPRRFGKSLLISTLEAYFNGQQELFKGLEMERLEKEWTKYPVLHLDLNTSKYDEKNSLIDILNDTLCQWENIYGAVSSEVNPELRFKGIIRRAYEQTGQRVVILVDEYDKPMLQSIRGTAERIPQHAQSLLLRNEDARPVYPFRIPDGGDEIRKGQCVQRLEQPDRPLHGPTVPDALRNDRQGDTHLF